MIQFLILAGGALALVLVLAWGLSSKEEWARIRSHARERLQDFSRVSLALSIFVSLSLLAWACAGTDPPEVREYGGGHHAAAIVFVAGVMFAVLVMVAPDRE